MSKVLIDFKVVIRVYSYLPSQMKGGYWIACGWLGYNVLIVDVPTRRHHLHASHHCSLKKKETGTRLLRERSARDIYCGSHRVLAVCPLKSWVQAPRQSLSSKLDTGSLAQWDAHVASADLTASARSLSMFGREKEGALSYSRHANADGGIKSYYPPSACQIVVTLGRFLLLTGG